ncbi:MAG: cytidylyltransferase domain-containing protein [Cetobacterium sp.]|uniref:acylneuraminate cytidylyltransferase family protein n=1 Tax=Cetobacterium sp. TaxID=2071632 RepID=UPI003F3530EC
MYKNKKILAIIPARGGSKGVPKKNIIEICGKPLIAYSIHCGLDSKYIDKVFVSTDDREIARVAKSFGGEVPFLRPEELAQDGSKTIDSLVYTVNKLKELGETYDYLVLLQPTVPLRKTFHVDEAIEKLLESDFYDLVSVSEVHDHPILMRKIKDSGELENLLPLPSSVRRQDFPSVYRVDGAIYIMKLDENFNLNTSPNDGKLSYIMEKKYTTDIDTYLDIKIVEYYLEEERKEIAKFMK